jgi:transposase
MKIDGRRVGHSTLERIRIAAVRLVVAEGRTPTQAAREMGVDRRRVYGWMARHRAGGWEALRSRKATGRPTRLDGGQIQWLYRTITAKSPFQLKVPFALWTCSRVRTLIMRKFAVKLSPVTVRRLLAQLGFACPKPLFRANKRRAAAIAQWLKKEYPGIRAKAKRERAEIFFVVESGIYPDERAGAWTGRQEARRAGDSPGAPDMNMICVVTSKSAMRFMVVRGRIGAGEFKEFLKRLMRARRRLTYLIVDGFPSQRSGKVQAYVQSLEGRLRLLLLPPAAQAPGRR